MLVVTMIDVPGYRVTAVLGEVMGVTVRSRNVFSQMGAGFKSIAGGELKGMTENLYQSRMEATNRMVEEAKQRGANAVIALRYDGGSIGNTWSELCAYGTAVIIEPIAGGPEATAQSMQHASGGNAQPAPQPMPQPAPQAMPQAMPQPPGPPPAQPSPPLY